jgi:hypothetical protein
VADRYGARWSLVVGATSGLLAALVGLRYLVRYRGLRMERHGARWRIRMNALEPAVPEGGQHFRAPDGAARKTA